MELGLDTFGDVTGLHPDHVDLVGGVIQDQEDLAALVLETLLADMSEIGVLVDEPLAAAIDEDAAPHSVWDRHG